MKKMAVPKHRWVVVVALTILVTTSYADTDKSEAKSWRLQNIPTRSALTTVDAHGNNTVVAGGKSGDVILWDGHSWKALPRLPVPSYWESKVPAIRQVQWANSRGSQIVDIDIVSPRSIWVITERDIFQWNGERWKEYPVYPIPGIRYPTFYKIQMTSKDHGYVVGSQPPSKALVLELKKDKWLIKEPGDVSTPSTASKGVEELFALTLLPSGEGWAGGRNAFVRIASGKIVKTRDAPYKNFFVGDIALENNATGWAVHHGTLYALKEGRWFYAREVCGPYCVQGGSLGSNSSISTNASGAAFVAGSHMSEAPRLIGSSIARWNAKKKSWVRDFYIKKEEITDIVVLDNGRVFAVALSGKVWSRTPENQSTRN